MELESVNPAHIIGPMRLPYTHEHLSLGALSETKIGLVVKERKVGLASIHRRLKLHEEREEMPLPIIAGMAVPGGPR
jgi:hypothetical protein